MNGNRSLTLDTLVDRVMVDPMSFIERILQEVLDQLDRDGVFGETDSNNKPEQLVATVDPGRNLARVITAETGRVQGAPPVKATAVETSPAASDGPAVEVALIDDYEQLVERNGDLAAALGACDCWGKQPSCPICDGEGPRVGFLPTRRFSPRDQVPRSEGGLPGEAGRRANRRTPLRPAMEGGELTCRCGPTTWTWTWTSTATKRKPTARTWVTGERTSTGRATAKTSRR